MQRGTGEMQKKMLCKNCYNAPRAAVYGYVNSEDESTASVITNDENLALDFAPKLKKNLAKNDIC